MLKICVSFQNYKHELAVQVLQSMSRSYQGASSQRNSVSLHYLMENRSDVSQGRPALAILRCAYFLCWLADATIVAMSV